MTTTYFDCAPGTGTRRTACTCDARFVIAVDDDIWYDNECDSFFSTSPYLAKRIWGLTAWAGALITPRNESLFLVSTADGRLELYRREPNNRWRNVGTFARFESVKGPLPGGAS